MILDPDSLDEMGHLAMAELDTLPLADLARLLQRLEAAEDTTRLYKQLLQAAMHRRVGERVPQLGQELDKHTGMVRSKMEDSPVIADLPNQVEHDQCTVKSGKPTYTLERIVDGGGPDAANDSHFGEAV